jgi:hypothetical protein
LSADVPDVVLSAAGEGVADSEEEEGFVDGGDPLELFRESLI